MRTNLMQKSINDQTMDKIKGDLEVTGNLLVDGTTTLEGTTFVDDTFGVAGAVTLNSTLGVVGNTHLGGTLTVDEATILSTTLAVTGNSTIGGTLGVTGNTTVGGTLAITGNETVGGTLAVTGNETIGGTLGVTSNATIGGTLAVTGTGTINGQNPNLYTISGRITSLLIAGDTYFPIPKAGTIIAITVSIQGVLTVGNATLTPTINGVAITNGAITVIQAGSAAGDTYQAIPTGANVVAVGNKLKITVGGTDATATVCDVIFTLSY